MISKLPWNQKDLVLEFAKHSIICSKCSVCWNLGENTFLRQSLSLNDGQGRRYCKMHCQQIWRFQCSRSCFLSKIVEISWLNVTIASFMGWKTKAFLLVGKAVFVIGGVSGSTPGRSCLKNCFSRLYQCWFFFPPEIYCT